MTETPPLTRRPSTPDDLRIPHSMLCDAAFAEFITMRPATEKCTCGAGLVRLVVGK
jgi:hypothetical protein